MGCGVGDPPNANKVLKKKKKKSRLPGHSPPAKLDRTPDGVSPLASGLLVCNTQYPGACGH